MPLFRMPATRALFALCCCVALVGCAQAERAKASPREAPATASSYADRPEVRAFAAEVAARSTLDAAWIEAQLAQAQRQRTAQRLMMPAPAGTAKNWAAYRDRFIETQRVQAGVQFWNDNQATLERAEAQYGVPAHVVVGIVGVETFYGRITGTFRVLDVLATLAFDFPSGRSDRSAFFRAELEAYLLMCQREGIEPTQLKGSYAGAMGLPQFMPSSLNRFAVDYDGDGHIDLQDNPSDVIGSVANYLAQHGWQRGMAPIYTVAAPSDIRQRALLLVPDILPTFTAEQFAQMGAVLDDPGRVHNGLL
ncbi:MAG: lytic murein transglycosylase, partial [Rubrivivax sp.]